ncbi:MULTISPECIES: hypothetical protein [Aeromonas]|uniref:Uncharacterized protein n=1 Tax=Aeromonas bestiarum TaxID=105751 RepID=A0ABT7PWA8_9GAMM|nr:hypothetical protein [Aeromonas bestiarum]MDM5071375.1 hypothetical protein [Aeromonas bestiarum]
MANARQIHRQHHDPLTHIAGEMRPFIHTASRYRSSADVDLHY